MHFVTLYYSLRYMPAVMNFENKHTFPFRFVGRDTGVKVAEGHKASFCLEDTKCDPGFERVWNCTDRGDQGISPGCYDIYYYNIDCQWVDVSDFVHGGFNLRVHLNPGNQVAESDFKNNVAKCSVYDYGSYLICNKCWIGKFHLYKTTASCVISSLGKPALQRVCRSRYRLITRHMRLHPLDRFGIKIICSEGL